MPSGNGLRRWKRGCELGGKFTARLAFLRNDFFADLVAVLGGIVFLIAALHFAHHQHPVIDEGTYLYKGLLFARGVYHPFQPNGPWMNHMPLSFLIPGYVQAWFGPGLDVGRYFSVFMALVMLAGLWVLTHQLAGKWWASAAVWAFAATPAAEKIYSLAISQVIVAAMLVWVLALLADEQGKWWRLAAAGVLAGIMAVTRFNMIAAWVILDLFVSLEWKKRSVWFWATSLVVVLGVHALYWPRIVWLWARWLPASIHVPPQFGVDLSHAPRVHHFGTTLQDRLGAFLGALRSFPLAWAGLFAGTAAWATYKPKGGFTRRFLAAGVLLAWALIILHGWASLGKSYCVHCFITYTAFYAPVMLAVGAVGLRLWIPSPRLAVVFWLNALLFTLLAASNVPVLLFLLPDTMHKFGLRRGYYTIERLQLWPHEHLFPRLSPSAAGTLFWASVAFGLFLLLILTLWLFKRCWLSLAANKSAWLAGLALLFAFSPTVLLSNSWRPYDCGKDVLAEHRKAAKSIARALPSSAVVYWDAYTPTVLLRAEGIKLFPQQLNGGYNFRRDGDDQALASWGYWNDHLAEQWFAQADFVVTDARNLSARRATDPHWLADFHLVKVVHLGACLGNKGEVEIFRRSGP